MDFKTVLTVISMVVAGVAAFFAYQGSNQTELHKLDKRLIKLETANQGEGGISDAIPGGAVIASLNRCTDLGDKWSDYEEAAGRLIVGVGTETIEGFDRTFRLDEEGGYYSHVLQAEELPPFSFSATGKYEDRFVGSYRINGVNKETNQGEPETVPENGWTKYITSGNQTSGDGPAYDLQLRGEKIERQISLNASSTTGGRPHNNMPPYVALYFCKKEG